MFSLSSEKNEMSYLTCKKCDHGMGMHGCVEGIGYCMEGNGDWCNCTEKGLTYDEELKLLK
tara:strand:+ start:229 stop:411 length:183 start_codon:yes stop_codon:yes gene_type:complete